MELLRQIKNCHARIPVIFVSKNLTLELTRQALSLDYGADFVLSKPFKTNELQRMVRECLEKGGKNLAFKILHAYKKDNRSPGTIHPKYIHREKRLRAMKEWIEKVTGHGPSAN